MVRSNLGTGCDYSDSRCNDTLWRKSGIDMRINVDGSSTIAQLDTARYRVKFLACEAKLADAKRDKRQWSSKYPSNRTSNYFERNGSISSKHAGAIYAGTNPTNDACSCYGSGEQ